MHDFLRPYGGAGGGGWTTRTATVPRIYPHQAANVVQAAAVAPAWSAWANLSAGVSADYYPDFLSVMFLISTNTTTLAWVEYEIGVGSPQSNYSYHRETFMSFFTGDGDPIIAYGRTVPIGPTLIASGTQLSIRSRSNIAASVGSATVCPYIHGWDSSPPASDTTHALDNVLGGVNTPHHLVTPVGSFLAVTSAAFPTWGTPVTFIASAPADLLLWGVAQSITSVTQAVGTWARLNTSGTPREIVPMPASFPTMSGTYYLRRPVYVQSGESVEIDTSGVASRTHQLALLYTEL